jgi:hypothetical protein
MKVIVLLVLFALISFTFANQVQEQKDMEEIKASFQKAFLKVILKKEKSECADSTAQLRKVWIFLPPSVQKALLQDVTMQIAQQFPRIPFETVEKLVKNFVDKSVPAQEACDFAYKIISEEVRRREECLNKCIEDADLTPERIVRTVAKCKFEWRCYLNEVEELMQSLGQCIAGCIQKNIQLE